ncbi:hypothetical protein HWV62_44099 [Athelia sp. TMB]|nr:hypothetical protein HWV62_44099 [Athelia sp. TMB]
MLFRAAFIPVALSALGVVASPLQATKRSGISTTLYNDLVWYFQYASSAYSASCPHPNGNTLIEEFTDSTTYTQGFIARDDTRKEIIVALRGSSSVGDFITDAELLLEDYSSPGVTPPSGVSAHSGFLDAWNSVAAGVISSVKAQVAAHPSYAIVTSGHSLGGSLSSLAAVSMKYNFPNNAVRMYTYGQPRTGNDAYAYWVNDQFGAQAFRSTHTYDGQVSCIEYWQNPDPATAANTVECAADGEDPNCSASIPSLGIDLEHTVSSNLSTMSESLEIDITDATTAVVRLAKDENRLESLTIRIIRTELEKTMKLKKDTLNTKPYRDAMKKIVDDVLGEDESAKEQEESVEAKRKADEIAEAAKTAKKPKPRVVKKPLSLSATPAKETKEATSSKRKKQYKSDTIDTSDEEEVPSAKKSKSPEKGPSKKRTKVDNEDDGPSAPSVRKPSSSKSVKPPHTLPEAGSSSLATKETLESKTSEEECQGERSDSEMSVLIDATPIKRKDKGKGNADKKPDKAPKSKKTSEPAKSKKASKPGLTKDEEAVKRLKSYVNACGVRKVWAKEFQNLDKPSQQIKRVKEILAELGMDGRPSMEKAKLTEEDVRSFEQSITKQTSRTRSNAAKVDESESEAEYSDRAAPSKQRNAARRSIMAFLGDDKESE